MQSAQSCFQCVIPDSDPESILFNQSATRLPSLRTCSGVYSFQSLRHDSGVNNNCRRGKLQRRVLSERSEFTRLSAEPCRLLENGSVLAGFAALLPPKVPEQSALIDSDLRQNDVTMAQ